MTAPAEQVLCRLDELADGASRGFLRQRNSDLVFAVRQGARVVVYRNSCPHEWLEMELARDRFLTADGRKILCYAHGAHFDIATGECTDGVCEGQFLVAVPCRIDDGVVLIPAELPPIPCVRPADPA